MPLIRNQTPSKMFTNELVEVYVLSKLSLSPSDTSLWSDCMPSHSFAYFPSKSFLNAPGGQTNVSQGYSVAGGPCRMAGWPWVRRVAVESISVACWVCAARSPPTELWGPELHGINWEGDILNPVSMGPGVMRWRRRRQGGCLGRNKCSCHPQRHQLSHGS